MARINVDDEIFGDYRFRRLVRNLGNEDQAIGLLVRFWKLAQKYWGDNQSLIPLGEFKAEEFQPILDAGLAVAKESCEETLVYACGSEERFAWYLQKCDASKKGVQARKMTGDHPRSTGALSPVNPLVPALAPAPAPAPALAPDPALFNLIQGGFETPMESLKFDFELIYQKFPKRFGDSRKADGMSLCKNRITTRQDYDQLGVAVDNYRTYCDLTGKTGTEGVKQFGTFMNKVWLEWIIPPVQNKIKTSDDLRRERSDAVFQKLLTSASRSL